MWNLLDNVIAYSFLGVWAGSIVTMIGLVS